MNVDDRIENYRELKAENIHLRWVISLMEN